MAQCVQCGERPIGASGSLLCTDCSAALGSCPGLLPDHILSKLDRATADGWLVDAWGHAHAVRAGTVVGRMPDHDFVILNATVSREHARLAEEEGGWEVRDLGSRNWTQVDGARVQGRAPFADGAMLRFGEAAFYFRARLDDALVVTGRPGVTAAVADSGTLRYTLRGQTASTELCLLGTVAPDGSNDVGGVLLYREHGTDDWSELNLPALEFQLLAMLCRQWLDEAGSPARARGCVATKRLADELPFQSRYANEDNVRQVVRRLRATLKKVGVADLVEAVPGRGYYVTWQVSKS